MNRPVVTALAAEAIVVIAIFIIASIITSAGGIVCAVAECF